MYNKLQFFDNVAKYMCYFLQAVSKAVVCILYKKELNSVANQQLIWDLADIVDNELLHNQIVYLYSFTYKSQRLVKWLYFIALVQRVVLMFLGQDVMPIMKPCTIEREWFWYYVSFQLILVCLSVVIITSIDLLFVGACSMIMAQFKIANNVIQVMDFDSPAFSDAQHKFVSKYCELSR